MIRKLALLIAPLLLLVLAEIIFRLGAWEPLSTPLSHAGTSVRLKGSLLDANLPKIDFVTLGSSLPEYGIDHAQLALIAKNHGFVHANLSMPGSHWMTLGVLSNWLHRHRPEIQGGIISVSIADFAFAGNGAYELGIVQPFRNQDDTAWITAHVPFDADNVQTYAIHSALLAWRDDVRDLLLHPSRLLRLVRGALKPRPLRSLFTNPDSSGDMCGHSLDPLSSCANLASTPDSLANLKQQCIQVHDSQTARLDYSALMSQRPPPEFMLHTKTLIESQIPALHWRVPPVVVLMPVPKISRFEPKSSGLHQWALQILKPLVDSGRIRLIDATDFFADDKEGDCGKFFDFYHQNDAGRRQLSEWLLPQIEALLYAPG